MTVATAPRSSACSRRGAAPRSRRAHEMSDAWTLTALRYASRMTTRSDVFLRYGQYGEPDGPLEMAYYLWVLRNATQTIVVDTGFSTAAGAARGRTFLVEALQAPPRA